MDPNDDPELALALRVSMEEQRARQQAEGGERIPKPPTIIGIITPQSLASALHNYWYQHSSIKGGETEAAVPATPGQGEESSEEALLQRALAMSMDT